MPDRDATALMAHLMRRAGFGATREELEARVAKGYEATVEELLHPEEQLPIDEELLYRHLPHYEGAGGIYVAQADWMYRMINTKRPLEEKMTLLLAPVVRHRRQQGGQPAGAHCANSHVP